MPNAITQCFLPGFEPRPLDPEIDEHTHNEATALPREIRGLFDIANGKQLNTGLVRQVRLIRVYISFFYQSSCLLCIVQEMQYISLGIDSGGFFQPIQIFSGLHVC